MNSKNEKKNIEIVSGNVEDLDISPVYSHLPISKPKTNRKPNKQIIIPNEKKKKDK